MNDYYSAFPQPSADVRARNLVDVVLRDKKFNGKFSPDDLKKLALDVVKDSKDYSMSGYNVFGYAEERARLYGVLDDLISKN